jgi:hypothetical protein
MLINNESWLIHGHYSHSNCDNEVFFGLLDPHSLNLVIHLQQFLFCSAELGKLVSFSKLCFQNLIFNFLF